MGNKFEFILPDTLLGSDNNDEINDFISIIPQETDDANLKKSAPEVLPILPLRNTVLFPNTVIPITLSREKSISLINEIYKGDKKIGVVAQKSQETDEPGPQDLFQIGTYANIIKKIKLPDESTMVIIQGIQKFMIEEFVQVQPYMKAKIFGIPERKQKIDKKMEAMIESMKDMAIQIVELSPNIPKEASIAIRNLESPQFLLNYIATNLNVDVSEKQKILEQNDLRQQLQIVLEFLGKELDMLQIKNEIQSKVRTDIDKQQRDWYLHQQLKTIHEELGIYTPEKEIEEFRNKAKEKKWTAQVQEVFDKELQKLARMNPAAAEYSVIANYLGLLLDLPWNEFTIDNLDLKKAKKILDKDHYGIDKVKERILEYLSVIKLKGDMKSPILCLVGPPGVGKTSLGRSVARAMGRKYIRMSLGGLHDEAEIRGHRKTYIGAMPGRIIQSIKKAKSSNPVIVLDELDKVGRDYKGDPASALLEVLDPEQNHSFYDNFLEMEFDLSHVMFLATSNTLETIHPALRDRLEIIELSGYLIDEKVHIAKEHLIPKQLEMHGLKKEQLKIDQKILQAIVEQYTRESGVRLLEKKIAKICRWQARQIIAEEGFDPVIRENMLTEILGPKVFLHDTYQNDKLPGLVRGLAWTASGGDVLYIEVSLSPGKGNLILTGTLGDVMKESATLALSYLKSHYAAFGIKPSAFTNWDIHIHVPEGAVPKEGPSAGITLLTALVSAFTQRRVHENFAMTGELTLRGVVLPVGGVKEKIIAARRNGVSDVILCESNRKDVEDINERYLKGLKFHYVKNASEVIGIALEKQPVKGALNINEPDFIKKEG